MATRLDHQAVAEIVTAINSTNRRRREAGKGDLSDAVPIYRDSGLTPYRYRVDLRRACLSSAWLRELQDTTPGLTDAHLDTAMRSAIAQTFHESVRGWATSQPLKH